MTIFRPKTVEKILDADKKVKDLVNSNGTPAEIRQARAVADAARRNATADELYEVDTEDWRRGKK